MRRIALLLGLALLLTAPATAAARTLHVRPGQSIQAAVNHARAGDTIRVAKGTYRERGRRCFADPNEKCAVVVKKHGIRLIGAKGATLVARGSQYQGIAVGNANSTTCLKRRSKRVHGSYISGFTVKGFAHDGIFLSCVDNWRVTRVRALDNDEYGVFPVFSVDGRLDHSYASGSNDTGMYIGQSRKGRVDHNVAEKNVSGFELENTSGVRLDHNTARGNTAGILTFKLPDLIVKTNSGNTIESNTVTANNKANTCADEEDTVCKVPPGTGILVMAADRNIMRSNNVSGNDSFGIAVTNYCVALSVSEADCKKLDIQPDPDGNQVLSNNATDNGKNPDPGVPSIFAVDLAWDTSGKDNCWSMNTAGSVFPDPLPVCS